MLRLPSQSRRCPTGHTYRHGVIRPSTAVEIIENSLFGLLLSQLVREYFSTTNERDSSAVGSLEACDGR